MNLNLKLTLPALLALCALPLSALAVELRGTVTDKSTGKPVSGDVVALVDVQAGLKDVAKATTDAHGHFTLKRPDQAPYLLRATHQGAGYFIEAPKDETTQAEISVYDVAAKVEGVVIDEYVVGIVEAINGHIRVVERYMVHNRATPPRTQWSSRSFSIILPAEAVISTAQAQRPNGLPTNLKLASDGPKGHYAFDFPIQPNDGDKGTLFQVEYELPYSGSYTFHPQPTLAARTVWAMLPKGLNFVSGKAVSFASAPQDPSVQTYVAQKVAADQAVDFTISGSGSMPRDADAASAGDQSQQANGNQPGGGIGAPVATPDPITRFKGWILAALALILVVVAAILLRKPEDAPAAATQAAAQATDQPAQATTKEKSLLDVLKDELFALESEKASGSLSEAEYAEQKAALEVLLRRALKRQG